MKLGGKPKTEELENPELKQIHGRLEEERNKKGVPTCKILQGKKRRHGGAAIRYGEGLGVKTKQK